jgi:pimeloyl-ACP methyl ester carboxylesterase
MPDEQVVALVIGESAGWNSVVERLLVRSLKVLAFTDPFRDLVTDATAVRDAIADLGKPVVLVGHSYGGAVITEAAAASDAVRALVYVAAFAPDHGESADDLMNRSPGGVAADVPDAALRTPLPTAVPAWRSLPSWFVFGDEDLTIPVARHRRMARRAGARGIREVAGAPHTLHVSTPEVVSAAIADALRA